MNRTRKTALRRALKVVTQTRDGILESSSRGATGRLCDVEEGDHKREIQRLDKLAKDLRHWINRERR